MDLTQPYSYILSRPESMNTDLVRRSTNTLLVHVMTALKLEAGQIERERHLIKAVSTESSLSPCPEPFDEMLLIALAAKRRIHILSADTGFDQEDEIMNLNALNQIASTCVDLIWCIVRRQLNVKDGGLYVRRDTEGKLFVFSEKPRPNIINLMTGGEPE